MFGRGIITGLARLDGLPVAVMASDPFFYGGAWTADVCDKIIRFVDLAETFHLPIVYLCDCPGFHIGLEAEKAATIRKGVRAMAAVNQSSVPWCTFLVRNVFGVAGAVNQPSGRFSIRYAWLSARWGSLPLEGGIEAAYRAEIDAAPDRDAKIAEIEERLNSCARRSAPPRLSGSRRSSTRATPAGSRSNSPIWPKSCANPASAASACGRDSVIVQIVVPGLSPGRDPRQGRDPRRQPPELLKHGYRPRRYDGQRMHMRSTHAGSRTRRRHEGL